MKYKILVVDDHYETLDIIVMTLQSYGYETVYSASPLEALELANAEHPDLALVDMNMPEMNGMDVVRRLRSMPALSDIPIVMFTAEDQADQKKAGFAAGVDDYLIKPFEGDVIEESINRALSKTRLAREKNELESVLIVAGATCQTVTTLTQRINSQMVIVNGGLNLMQENAARPGGLSTYKSTKTILRDCLNSTDHIQAVLRVMEKITEVDLTAYHEDTHIMDINDALQKELASIRKNGA